MSKLIDLVKNGGYTDSAVGIIDEVTKAVPEMKYFDARIINGTQFQSVYKNGLPTVGFRTVGNGIDTSRSSYGLRTYKLGILAGLCQIDKAEAQASCQSGGAASVEEFLGNEASDFVTAGMAELASKIWYGDKSQAEGFDGVSTLAEIIIDAGDSTANKVSSVYAVGIDAAKGCGLVFGKNSGFFLEKDLEWTTGTMTGANGKPVPCHQADLTGWAGFAAVNAKKMARLANLGAVSHTLTDALLAKLVNAYRKANNGLNPTALFASFDQLSFLQQARSTVAPSVGKVVREVTAAFPTDFEGIPLVASNAIVDTEAVWTEEESSSSSQG
jgi:hypothetical protein